MEKVVALLAVALTVSVDCTSKEFFQTGLLLNWTESMETCRQNFTELVTMQSEEEYQQFWSYIKLYEGLYWIGLQFNSSNINNTWKWVNGNPTTYSHWAVPPTGAGCGAFNSSSGGWFILNCSYGLMSVCQGIITVGGNDPGKKCVFPFYYGGYQYFGCTIMNNNNIPWCATTTDYSTDKKWGNCPFTGPHTTGGNSNGAPCQFPFKYNNMDYYSCTTDGRNSKELWCATVSNYGEDPKWGFCTTSESSQPGEINVDFVGDDSVSLSWGRPVGMDGVKYSFNITYSCSFWGHNSSTIAPSNFIVISNLRSGSEYVFNITTVQDTGSQSTPASISLYTKPSQPGEISVDFVGDDSVSLSWGRPVGMDGVKYSFNITYSCSFWGHNSSTIAPSNSIVISNLRSGSEYVFNITTVQDTGSQSTPASISLYTKPSQPGEISVDFVGDDSVSLSWGRPVGMDGVKYSFNITYSCSFWGHSGSTIAPSNSIVISNLRSGSEYVFNTTTVQDTGSQSTPASISLYTKPKEKRFYLKFVCSSTEPSVCENEKQKVQQEFEAKLAEQLKGLYWKLNWKEKEVKECSDEPEEDV